MPSAADIEWFKREFHRPIAAGIAGTPFDLDMVTAIACQETGYIWQILRRTSLTTGQILALCVGDTIDATATGGRRAFPRTKADLIAVPNGPRMFDIARDALVRMARHIPSYAAVAAKPNKFCHGFGVFQCDLQFFRVDPDYFLERRYERFEATLRKCIEELRRAIATIGWGGRPSLSDFEAACVAIAYNTGRFRPERGLKQGFQSAAGRYYGEEIFDFIRLARQVSTPGGPAPTPAPPAGSAALPPPTPVTATGAFYVVDTRVNTLRLRREPRISVPPTANVIADLPDGHVVRAVRAGIRNGFREVETSLSGAHFLGFASARYLKAATGAPEITVVVPAAMPPVSGIVAVHMPVTGTITKRSAIAGASALNERGQPRRLGTTPDELRNELAAIVDWLAVDKPSHQRYQPRQGLTFCNVYAHDYCHLAGVYLPRVWWTPRALEKLAQGETVVPRYGDMVVEVRANDLFRWLRDFGPRFGWRQTGTLSKLQQEANQGAIGLIAARRREDGRSGHIVVVVPEIADRRARRDGNAEVIAPLQSQAGASNFRYGTGTRDWWKGQQFAESALWLHA